MESKFGVSLGERARLQLFRRPNGTVRVVSDLRPGPNDVLTRQEPRDGCDLNEIVARARRGIAPVFSNKQPLYGDFTNVPSLAESHEVVERAKEAFMTLPASARAELGNDFTKLNTVDAAFLQRHGLKALKEPGNAPGASPDGVEGGTPSKEPKAPKAKPKASEAAASDPQGQE